MSRAHHPGTVELAGNGRVYFINAKGEHVAFDSKRYRDARPWARGIRRDDREMVL